MRVAGNNLDSAALSTKFHSIANEIQKYLLKPGWICFQPRILCVELTVKSQPSRLNFLAEEGGSGMNKVVNVYQALFRGKASRFRSWSDRGDRRSGVPRVRRCDADAEDPSEASPGSALVASHDERVARTGVSGVRSSCESAARNLSLALLEASICFLGTNQRALEFLVSCKISKDEDHPAHGSI